MWKGKLKSENRILLSVENLSLSPSLSDTVKWRYTNSDRRCHLMCRQTMNRNSFRRWTNEQWSAETIAGSILDSARSALVFYSLFVVANLFELGPDSSTADWRATANKWIIKYAKRSYLAHFVRDGNEILLRSQLPLNVFAVRIYVCFYLAECTNSIRFVCSAINSPCNDFVLHRQHAVDTKAIFICFSIYLHFRISYVLWIFRCTPNRTNNN